MSKPFVLGIDQGTSGSRALIVDREGALRGYAHVPLERLYPRPDRVEQDPVALADGVSQAITAAIAATNLDTIVGNVNWSNGPVPNVTKTPLVGGQWQRDGDTLDLKIVANAQQPNIPLTGELKLLN